MESWSGLSRFLSSSFEPTDQGKCCCHWPVLDKHEAASGAPAQGGAHRLCRDCRGWRNVESMFWGPESKMCW